MGGRVAPLGARVALAQHFAHGVSYDGGEIAHQGVDLSLEIVDLSLQIVDLSLYPIEAHPDGSEIVTVAARLFEYTAGHQLLALDFALHHTTRGFNFFPAA